MRPTCMGNTPVQKASDLSAAPSTFSPSRATGIRPESPMLIASSGPSPCYHVPLQVAVAVPNDPFAADLGLRYRPDPRHAWAQCGPRRASAQQEDREAGQKEE